MNMPYRESRVPQHPPRPVYPPRTIGQHLRTQWVQFRGQVMLREARQWAGGAWTPDWSMQVGVVLVVAPYVWVPIDRCPHVGFKPVLLMPGGDLADIYSTCGCEYWP